jgi:hypothetical protein
MSSSQHVPDPQPRTLGPDEYDPTLYRVEPQQEWLSGSWTLSGRHTGARRVRRRRRLLAHPRTGGSGVAAARDEFLAHATEIARAEGAVIDP